MNNLRHNCYETTYILKQVRYPHHNDITKYIDLPMNEVPVMYVLNAGDKLISEKQNSLE